ncbi:hypothetical protein HYH03_008180 [Edaphochlamys debaryana]|uniref:Endonuclease/exonuclease/phosphatase domain-containing protein n=1 Tax=Edaphochlamys debaryana TaxID=47281 RepID=A0A835Y0K2_9CHLO|nr:hypothetical protein HYH03_008180 [Edaphochlamys debaryana]|eukprot:KAG2493666.1 hypothetical protein HYH03_008180 [Edaphochlamys debaryana]
MAERGVRGEFLARQVSPVPGPAEGIALLWRDASLQALGAPRVIKFSDLEPGLAGLPPGVEGTAAWSKVRALGEGAVLALLRHRASGRLLVGACTHLFWDPTYPDVKALQAALLCGAIAAFAREAAAQEPPGPGGVGTVLMGDFNSLASKRAADRFDPQLPPGGFESGVYTLLSTGALAPEHPDHPATRVWAQPQAGAAAGPRFPAVPLQASGLSLASLSAQVWGREPPLTNRTASFAGCLDYVWLSTPHLAAASALAMPFDDGGWPPMGPQATTAAAATAGAGTGAGAATQEPRPGSWVDPVKDVAFGAVPDEHWPSDHLPVGGELLLL